MYLQIKRAIMASLLSMICFVAYAQQTVTGTVKDATGEPMIGVTVLLNGQAAAVTDIDGNFSIKAEPKDVVKVSYIGYTDQQITVGNKTSLDIVLQEDSQTLNEVVVVGYGTMKKSDLTGSVSSVNTDQLNAKGTSSPIASLQGSVPGVNITQSTGRTNGGFNVEIRGKSSTNSDLKPIYVIDGVVCDDMDFLNPQDIERIDVLKDASSTAIYGSRATAGVIMVTTKSGAGVSKRGQQKPTVSYDGYVGVVKTARMPDFMDTNEFYKYRFLKFLSYAEGGSATALSGQPAYTMNTYDTMSLWKTDPDNPNGGYSVMKQMLKNGQSYDWPKEVTRTGFQQNHYLAVSGTVGEHNDVSYHFGVGYNQEKGVYRGDDSKKINFKGSVDAKLTSWLTSGFSFNAARQENKYADDNGVQYAYRMNPFMRPRNDDGTVIDKPGSYVNMGSDNGKQFSDQVSPLILLDNQQKERETWRFLGNFYMQIQPIKEVTIKSTFAPNFSQYRQGTYNAANDLIKGYEDNNGEGDGNRAIHQTHRNFSWTWTNQINFNKTFNDVHTVDFLALNEVISSNSENLQVTSRRVLDGSQWYNVGSASDPSKTVTTSSYTETSMISYALRANYTYAGKYMATATIRWDGSSKFADGHRWGSFPSFALAWRASEEEFLKKIDWLSNLKFRLSYGVTGNNSGINNYATQQTVASGVNYYPFGGTYYSGYYPSGVVDKLLTWEKSHELNFGVDFGFLNNRISGSIDIYNKTSKDLLFDVTLPLEAGLNGSDLKKMTTNVGKVQNKGIEFTLTTVNIENQDWRWETTFNYAHNKNEIKEINGTGQSLPADALFIGEPYNNVYQYNWTGIVTDRNMAVPNNDAAKNAGYTPGEVVRECDYYHKVYGWTEGNPIIADLDGNGTINDNDKQVFRKDPIWTGSFTSNLSWREWDFSFSIYTKQGYKVASNFYEEYLNYNDRGRMKLNMDYYIPAGTLIDCDGVNADGTYINPVYQQQTHYGDYPFPNNAAASSGVGAAQWLGAANKVTDASFVKVKYITLGYTFPKKWINKIGINKLRLYCTVTNPFVFTKYKGFDPEWADATNKNDGPSTVTWQFGASLKF